MSWCFYTIKRRLGMTCFVFNMNCLSSICFNIDSLMCLMFLFGLATTLYGFRSIYMNPLNFHRMSSEILWFKNQMYAFVMTWYEFLCLLYESLKVFPIYYHFLLIWLFLYCVETIAYDLPTAPPKPGRDPLQFQLFWARSCVVSYVLPRSGVRCGWKFSFGRSRLRGVGSLA